MDRGNSNPHGPDAYNGNNPKLNQMTGEPLDPNHWDYLR